MSSKLIDFQPTITCVNLKNEKLFEDVTAVAIPVGANEKPSITKSAVASNLTIYTKIDLNIELSNWPEFSAKAGEIIEIPLSVGKLTRIYLVGIGESNQDDIRKASAALSRKVKGTDAKVLSALVEDKKTVETMVIALVLANYQFSMKSEKKSKKPSFVVYGDFKEEVESALVYAKATWRTRDLIHTPSNIKNPSWFAEQAKSMVAATKNSALTIKVKSGRELREFGGLLAVGNSAPKPGPIGISIFSTRLFVYSYVGMLSALMGVMYWSRLYYINPDILYGFIELSIIAAVVIGGAKLTGGEGTILGTFLGLIVYQLFTNTLVYLGLTPDWSQLFFGSVLITMLIVIYYRQRQANKKALVFSTM